jgi:N-succinyldiaminopimelate aminotransferase
MTRTAARVASFGTTIFSEMTALAARYNAVNLGQGKPDFDGPPEIIQAAMQALSSGDYNQYAPGIGLPALRAAIAAHEAQFYGITLDPERQITVSVGATEGIFAAVLGLTDPGDEVIVFEPFYDSYVPNLQMAGAIPRYCPLRPPAWTFDPDELRALFTDKTRAIIVNTPHNPTGKVFSAEELSLIADLCQAHDVLAITDEVYEHLVYDGVQHKSLLAWPGMGERTVKVSSLGKTFSLTGWKIGWCVGDAALVAAVQRARQFMSFAAAHPLQVGAAYALRLPTAYYEELIALFEPKRDRMVAILGRAGLKPEIPQGGYFIMADFSGVFDGDDVTFAKWLTLEVGVTCIPPTFLYSEANKHLVARQARFAFCKSDAVLDAAEERFSWFSRG